MKKQLSKSELKELNQAISDAFGVTDFFGKKDVVELVDKKYVSRDDARLFFYHDKTLVPSLRLLLQQRMLKHVEVDMGAVKFVTNGADIMRPGIVSMENGISKGNLVVIIDEKHHKPLAVGIMLLDGREAMESVEGKIIRNIHHVGDAVWG